MERYGEIGIALAFGLGLISAVAWAIGKVLQ